MTIDMYLGDASAQITSMNTFCIEAIQAFEKAIDELNAFARNIVLQGATYSSAKNYAHDMLIPLAQGMIRLCEELIRQNDKYLTSFKADVSSMDVIEQEILDQIKEIELTQERLSQIPLPPGISGSNLQGIWEATKKILVAKLDKLYQFNTTSASNYEVAIQLANQVEQGLGQVSSGFHGSSGTFSTAGMDLGWKDQLDKIYYTRKAKEKYGDYLEEHPDALDKIITIVKYEELHPDLVEQTNGFLSPIEKQNSKDFIEIKYLIYTAEEPQRSLCLEYMSKYKVQFLSEQEIGKETPASFSPSGNIIKVDMGEDRSNPRGNYYTFFHEMGHAIDYYYGKENGISSSYSSIFKTNGKTLTDYNYVDVEINIRNSLGTLLNSEVYNGLSETGKKQMIDNISKNLLMQDRNFDNLTNDEQNLQVNLQDYYYKRDGGVVSGKFAGDEAEGPSDVYGGVTDRAIQGKWGHSDGYWFDSNGKLVTNPNKECFAEFFGRTMIDGEAKEAGLESIGTYLPESKEHMEAMLDSMR
ncbi:hypothetical protein HCA81_02055 [Listeria booriae]|uniref:T7SS effector LXG polymorphic toxin n=1 Tax=Listeria booriae TaxID=1552123 RepID=UPI0016237228|nr:T7SS effector LXG polymorphic toxin [Listeria booriae]MBC2019811.1 hypothetical protein [Listeria booriae]